MAAVRGGEKFRAAIRAALAARSVHGVKVGFFKSAKYPDGTFVAAVAAWNHFGTKTIPERPFMLQAVKKSRDDVRELLERSINTKTLEVTPQIADELGALVTGEIQKRIVDLREPPNAPSTLRWKAPKTNPLINSGTMRTAVTWNVEL